MTFVPNTSLGGLNILMNKISKYSCPHKAYEYILSKERQTIIMKYNK